MTILRVSAVLAAVFAVAACVGAVGVLAVARWLPGMSGAGEL